MTPVFSLKHIEATVVYIFLYGCETSKVIAERRNQVFETECQRKLNPLHLLPGARDQRLGSEETQSPASPTWSTRPTTGCGGNSIPCISYLEHETNDWVRSKTVFLAGPQKPLLTTVERWKLKWFGHVMRQDSLFKTILPGTLEGGRRRGRQRRCWMDNVKD